MKAKVTPHSAGNGYVATVESSDEFGPTTIYSSADEHPEAGVFAVETDAEAHASAMATALGERAKALEAHSRDLKIRWWEHRAQTKGQNADDRVVLGELKDSVKTMKARIAARDDRLDALATAVEEAAVEIVWTDKGDPASIETRAVASAFDQEPTETPAPASVQMSLPEVSWSVREEHGEVAELAGYGKVSLRERDGVMVLAVGEDEILVEVHGSLVQRDMGSNVVELKSYTRGKLAAAQVIQRLVGLRSPETLLAVYRLELSARSPRKAVLAALGDAMAEHDDSRVILDVQALDEGREPSVFKRLDMAAATILTGRGEFPVRRLEELVAACRDYQVICGLIEDEERREGEPRDGVLDVLYARRSELEPAAAAAKGE